MAKSSSNKTVDNMDQQLAAFLQYGKDMGKNSKNSTLSKLALINRTGTDKIFDMTHKKCEDNSNPYLRREP